MHDPSPEPSDSGVTSDHSEAADSGYGGNGRTADDAGFDLDAVWEMLQKTDERRTGDGLIGRQLGGVTLERLIGEGGMARVYEGRQLFPDRVVAVKVQRPERIDAEHSRRFLRELEILAKLRHPGVCSVHTAGILEEGSARSVWFVMDLVPEADTITGHAARRRLTLRERVDLFAAVCDAVAHGHALGIAHRDLKPRNILVGSDGQPKVIDFGVARAMGSLPLGTAFTHTGQLIGTLQYMPPEALDGTTQGDARGDIWALGVVLHELLIGAPPFDAADVPLTLAIERIRSHRPGLAALADGEPSSTLAAIVDRCLEPDSSRRLADAGLLAASLRAALGIDGDWNTQRLGVATGSTKRRRRVSRRGLVALGATAVGVIPLVAALTPFGSRSGEFRPGGPLQNPSSDDDDGRLRPVYDARPSPIESPDFSFHFGTVYSPGAEDAIVDRFNVRKHQEDFYPRASYWCTIEDDVVGWLTWRFVFPRPTARVFLAVGTSCYDYRLVHNGTNRGTSALDLSNDGDTWTTIRDDLDRDVWGKQSTFDELIPAPFVGTEVLWLRVRLLTVDSNPNAEYSLAQFCRAPATVIGDTFRLDADLLPLDDDAIGRMPPPVS